MEALAPPRNTSCYDEDWVLWIDAQVRLLLERRFSELDIENLVEELDHMKKHYSRQLKSRLIVLIMHLLKCQYQKERKKNKWRATVDEQRLRLSLLLADSPSTRQKMPLFATECYAAARRRAALETGLDPATFPTQLPYSISQLLDSEFMP